MQGRYTWDGTQGPGMEHKKRLTNTGLPEEPVGVLVVGASGEILLGDPEIDNVCII